MIKILQYGLNPTCGGIERSLYRLYSNIDRELFCFDFIDEWNGRACFRHEFENMGSKFYTITSRRKSILRNVEEWNAIPAEDYPDILHCHLNTLSYAYPIFWALKRNIPVIVHSRSSGMKGSIPTYFLHKLNQNRLKNIQINRLAVSMEAGRWMFGKDALFTVINNGIESNRFVFSNQNRQCIRTKLKIDDNTFVIGAVGHLSEEKNIPFMLNIIELLKEQNVDCVLMIIGDGVQEKQTKEMIKNKQITSRVLLLGHVSDPEKYYSAMDIFIMPSIKEGFPNAALEAQANGLRCLMSDTITKEVDAGLCKYLSIREGAKSWVNDILDFRNGNCNRESTIFISDFSVEKEVINISNLYKELLNRSNWV